MVNSGVFAAGRVRVSLIAVFSGVHVKKSPKLENTGGAEQAGSSDFERAGDAEQAL